MAAKESGRSSGGKWVPETCSAADLAAVLGIGGRAIDTWIQRGVFVRAEGRGRFQTLPSINGYAEALRAKAGGHASTTGKTLSDERAESEKVTREIQMIKLARIKGEVLSLDELTRGWSTFAKAVKSMVLAIPGKARSSIPHLTPHDAEVLKTMCNDILADLAEEVKTTVINGDSKEIADART